MKRFSLLLLDLSALYGALAITLFIRYPDNFWYQHSLHLLPFYFIFTLWLLVFYITNLYDITSIRNNLNFFSNLARAFLVSSATAISFFYFIPIFAITPKTNLFIFIAISAGLITGLRSLFNKAYEGGFRRPLLLVGLNAQTLELAKFVEANPQLGYELKYLLDLSKEGIKEVDQMIKTEKINTVVVSPETYQMPQIIDTFYHSLENKITFYNLSSFYEQLTNRVPLGAINQVWFLENFSEGNQRTYEEIKRVLDAILATLLGIIILPLIPLVAGVIKLSSKGPIFYYQTRRGQNGKTFKIIKFRTMKTDAEKDGAVWAKEDDPRVTKLGKFLRKSRIDELPQLWNILKGEMSFVGPRAERPEFHEQLKAGVPYYEERYIIKPGLTGWAQINYHYGSSVKDAAEKLQYDLYYIKNRSLVLDLGIILKTINIALRQAGR